MQVEGFQLVKELKEWLHKKKYKLAITKTQKFIKEQADLAHMCASIFIKILRFQSKAIIKILQKNILRKYVYDQLIVSSLLRIINRNIQRYHFILLNKIRDNSININQNEYEQKKHLYYQVNSFKTDVNSAQLKSYCQEFQQTYYESLLYFFTTMRIYNIPIDKNYLQNVQIMCNVTVQTVKCMLLKIQLNILLCRIYIEQGDSIKAEKKINTIIQEILLLFDRITKKSQKKCDLKQTNKFKYYYKKAFKLMMIASAIVVRVKMILNKQKIATYAIKIFYFLFQKCAIQFPHFQKYLKPQVYLYGQYCQYQLQKCQIANIIEFLFKDNSQLFKNDQQQTKCSNKDLISFYNQKMAQFHLKIQKSKQQKKLKRLKNNKISLSNGITENQPQLENPGIKQKKQIKQKNISFGNSSLSGFDKNKKRNSLMSQTDFYKPILKQINQINSVLLTNRKKQGIFFNPNHQIGLILSKNIQKSKNKNSTNVYVVNNKKAVKTSSLSSEKTTQDKQTLAKLQEEENFYNRQLKYHKQKLKQKGCTKFYKTIIANSIIDDTQNILSFKTPGTRNNNYTQPPIIDSAKQIQPVKNRNSFGSGNRIKQNIKHMLGKKSKIQQFMELLLQNRQYLGIKRLGQKIQYLKKKEQLKQKFRSTRKTTSIHYKQGQMSNFSFLAQDIIKFSLEDFDDKGQSNQNTKNVRIVRTQCLTNENNFKIGQKSISILMNKLQKENQTTLLANSLNIKNRGMHMNDSNVNRYSAQSRKLKKKASQWKCKFVL